MKPLRSIELLAPAKNLLVGTEAIKHGADAVYIGAPQFSARAAAGNSLADIKALVRYAHTYYAKVYVAFNTLIYEQELEQAAHLVQQLEELGVDALIVQDMALTQIPSSLPLHASTQMDNRTPEKVRFLEDIGFSQVVLARELSLTQIEEIAQQTTVPLEVFVHGALCVSYSGQCYISEALSKRSANRGECAQYCRLPYTLQDAKGTTLERNRHLLSMKDLNRSDSLEELLLAGVSSLKIEGRLKEVNYVKNVTAFYRQKLDALFAKHPDWQPASSGTVRHDFIPDLSKSFNRRYTDYFLHGRKPDILSKDTPTFTGVPVAKVKRIGKNYLEVSSTTRLNNGDGLGYFDADSVFKGFRVNRVEGAVLYPAEMPTLSLHTVLYRNFDQEFEKQIARPTAVRSLGLSLLLRDTDTGFALLASCEDGIEAEYTVDWPKELAVSNQDEALHKQLSKLGTTPFTLEHLVVQFTQAWFVPASVLSEMRRQVVALLEQKRAEAYPAQKRLPAKEGVLFPSKSISYLGNVSNSLARQAYTKYGVEQIDQAFELKNQSGVPLMFTKHCIKYDLGYCPRVPNSKKGLHEPLYLLSTQGRLELEFNCKACEMWVYKRP